MMRTRLPAKLLYVESAEPRKRDILATLHLNSPDAVRETIKLESCGMT